MGRQHLWAELSSRIVKFPVRCLAIWDSKGYQPRICNRSPACIPLACTEEMGVLSLWHSCQNWYLSHWMILTNATAVTGSVLIIADWSFRRQQAENLISWSLEHELAGGVPASGVPAGKRPPSEPLKTIDQLLGEHIPFIYLFFK